MFKLRIEKKIKRIDGMNSRKQRNTQKQKYWRERQCVQKKKKKKEALEYAMLTLHQTLQSLLSQMRMYREKGDESRS